jgi:DNA-binding transcriptional regulator YiaG
MYYRQQTPNFVPPTHLQPGVVMKHFENRSQARDFFEMTRSDFFTETASTPNDWLRELRQELDLTMSQIGELVGVNRIQVWKWETGRVTPPKSALISVLFLKIIRSIGERDLRLATYPTIRRVKLLAANKDLLQGNEGFLQLQKELRKKEIA